MKKWYKYALLFFGIGLISFSLFSGYLVGLHNFPPYGFFRRVELNLFGRSFEQKEEAKKGPEYYDSIFLRLYSNQTDISDRVRPGGSGGGLTSFGNAVLLVSWDGQIFSARSSDEIKKTNIVAPDNGYSAYQRAAKSERFKDLNHNFGLFRYNDILFYESGNNRGLALSYTEFDSTDNCYRNTVANLPITSDIQSVTQLSATADDWDILYRTKPCLPFKKMLTALNGGAAGGRLAFDPPSTLYVGSGDYHWDGVYARKAIAQDPEAEYGKIIGVNLESGKHHIVASGVRNPKEVVLDEKGSLWIVEHGFRGGDELNRIEEGKNYGWPVETLGTQYSKLPVPGSTSQSYGRHENFAEPTFAWLPSVAISNLTLIDGFHESWKGDLMMGSLKSKSLFRIRIKKNRVLFSEQINIGERIRYVHQHTDGRLVLWTDSEKLIFLTGEPFTNNVVDDYLVEKIEDEQLRRKIKTTINTCRKCHSLNPGDNANAPSLALIFNSEISSTNFKSYSAGLKAKQGFWTRKNLKQFLRDPEKFAPGTKMPDTGIHNETTLEELVNFMEALRSR